MVAAFAASAQTNGPDAIPPLCPPLPEVVVGFWARHGWWIGLCALAVAGLAAFLIWVLRCPMAPEFLPPEVEARRALEALRDQPEDDALLGQVSRILRRYLWFAFGWPAEELTTTELDPLITHVPFLPSDVSASFVQFLRRCDERKFGPHSSAPPLGAAAAAMDLIDRLEAQRRSAQA
jgi:hypothetical protein